MLVALLAPAFANGLSTHQWITLQAIDEVPAGPLHDLVSRADLRPYLELGALFPDGGYAVGDGYGEMAHWEPFQMRYLQWIRETGAGDEHKAFLLGMCSHGMADQAFDSMFMERSRVYDADLGWAEGESMDEATDVALVAAEGPGEVPEVWFPEVFASLFEEQGHVVTDDTLEQGTTLAGLAIGSVAVWGQIPDTVAQYDALFPWADGHIVDPEVRCSAVCESKMVARYWEVVWDRLEGGDGWSSPVIATVPEDGAWAQPIEAGSPESRLSVVFGRGLVSESVATGLITVADADGTDVPVGLSLFYGYASHVVLVAPTNGWEPDTDYVVTVHPGVVTFDGPVMEGEYTFSFSTRPAPVEEVVVDEAKPPVEDAGCGCGTGTSAGWAWLLALGMAARSRR